MKKLLIAQTLCLFSVMFFSCQRELTGDINSPNPLDKTCSLTQVSNLQWSSIQEDSTMYTKITYDSLGRILHVVTPKNDTSTYIYSTNSIEVDEPYTADNGTGGQDIYDYKEKYYLQPNGLASYSVTTLFGGTYLADSTAYTYDTQGELIEERYFGYWDPENATIDYAYSNGNLEKVTFKNTSSYFPDSINIKYSDQLMPGESFRIVYWDKYRHSDYYPWTGKMSKNMRSEAIYHYSSNTFQNIYNYNFDANGIPTAVRTTEIQPGISLENMTSFVQFNCK